MRLDMSSVGRRERLSSFREEVSIPDRKAGRALIRGPSLSTGTLKELSWITR